MYCYSLKIGGLSWGEGGIQPRPNQFLGQVFRFMFIRCSCLGPAGVLQESSFRSEPVVQTCHSPATKVDMPPNSKP